MLVVLDTNVLLSALRAERSLPAAILDAWRTARYSLVTSSEQIEEFKRAARYPKLRPYLPRRAVGRIVNELRSAEVLLERLRRAGTRRIRATTICWRWRPRLARIFSSPGTKPCSR